MTPVKHRRRRKLSAATEFSWRSLVFVGLRTNQILVFASGVRQRKNFIASCILKNH